MHLRKFTNRLLRKTTIFGNICLPNTPKNSFYLLFGPLVKSSCYYTYAKQHPSCPSLLVGNEFENCSVFNHIYCSLDYSIVYIHFRFLGSFCAFFFPSALLDTEFPRASFAVLAAFAATACVIGSSAAGSLATVASHPALWDAAKWPGILLHGSEILHHLGCYKNTVNNGKNYLSTGAGFLPSTVSQDEISSIGPQFVSSTGQQTQAANMFEVVWHGSLK